MRRIVLPAGGWIGWVALALVMGASLCFASPVYAQAAPAQQAQAAANQRLFANDAALVLNFVKPDKTADFEEVMGKLKEALQKSDKPERKQQAAGWKIFKSPDPAGGNVLYVFVIDPVVKGADYQISNLLAEAFGNTKETSDLYTKYAGAYAPQAMNMVNLQMLIDLSK